MAAEAGAQPWGWQAAVADPSLAARVSELATAGLESAYAIADKLADRTRRECTRKEIVIQGIDCLMSGIHPRVIHMNEGHSAFSSIERLAQTIERHGVDIRTALETVIPEDAPWGDEADGMVRTAMASLRTDVGEETGEGRESRDAITDPVALDSIRSLNALVRDLDEERNDAEAELRRARAAMDEEEGLINRLMNFLDGHDLRSSFVTLQTADDAPSKPHPGMIERALAETGTEAAEAVMIGVLM